MKSGIATCPFCNVINRFGENEKRCPHYLTKVGKKNKYLIKKEWDEDYAVFREEQEEVKVLVEEESNE